VRERVFRILNAKRTDQRLFLAAYDEVHPNAKPCNVRFVQLWKDPASPQLVQVKCAGPERDGIIGAWFKRGCDLIYELVRRVRLAEHKKSPHGHHFIDGEVLMRTGNIREEKHWCYNQNPEGADNLLTGSLTAPNVYPSRLSVEAGTATTAAAATTGTAATTARATRGRRTGSRG
jgi:hypothetical protein